MRISAAHLANLSFGMVISFTMTNCTTNSNLVSSNSAAGSATQRSHVSLEGATTPEAVEESMDSLVGTLPKPEMVAQDRPAQAKPAVVLASVPTTPVHHMPTNQIMMVRTTAYSHLQADSLPYGRKSAAGTDLKYGSKYRSAAADWSKYPLGTRFKIEGLPYEYVIDDYGSALCGTETIDIYKPDLSGIGRWGVRNVPIRVLEWGSFEESARILDSRKHVKHAHHVRTMLREIEKKGRAGYQSTDGGSA